METNPETPRIDDIIKLSLIIYQIVSMLLVFYFDFSDLVTFIKQNDDESVNVFKRMFINYNCYAQIWVNSSNWKRSLSLFMTVAALLKKDAQSRHAQQELEMQQNNNDQKDDTEAQTSTQIEPANATEPVDNGNNCKGCWGLCTGCKIFGTWYKLVWDQKYGRITMALHVLSWIYGLLLFPITMTHTLVSIWIYIWIIIIFLVILVIVFILVRFIVGLSCCCQCWRNWGLRIFGMEFTKDFKKDERGCLWYCNQCVPNSDSIIISTVSSPLTFAWIYTTYLFLVLSTAYLYGGQESKPKYFSSVYTVMTERKIVEYFENVTKSFSDVWGFVSALI